MAMQTKTNGIKNTHLQEIRTLITKSRNKIAIKKIIEFCQQNAMSQEVRNKAMILSNRYSAIDQREALGLNIDKKERNEVIYQILNMLSDIEVGLDPGIKTNLNTEIKTIVDREERRKGKMSFNTRLSISIIIAGGGVVLFSLGINASLILFVALLITLYICLRDVDL